MEMLISCKGVYKSLTDIIIETIKNIKYLIISILN